MTETPELTIYEKTFAKSDKTNAILVVQGKKLHVNKTLLSLHSDFFDTLFNSEFKEKAIEEIDIKDVKFEDFATLLSLIHPNPLKPTEFNAEKLLELADRLLMTSVKQQLEWFLITTNISRFTKLRIADKYQLDDLLQNAIDRIVKSDGFLTISNSNTFTNLSDKNKVKLLMHLLAANNQ
ncbi:hypothetical protein CAEBREN_25980 [Caenorhabditis brenneri]|uniref:BTB domain-containing protein n=1 Tax=Caenorhabditis brenneri TaxID=135651 RepID=G0MVW5_CAEBE|nr:hypothetical protein CAEBREN_25980 [Caenorhabditis brenneri]